MPQFVYILASRPDGALYMDHTHDLPAAMRHHKLGHIPHTATYQIDRLVWFEEQESFAQALRRTKTLKRWRRAWKVALIVEENPAWADLTPGLPPPVLHFGEEAPDHVRGPATHPVTAARP